VRVLPFDEVGVVAIHRPYKVGERGKKGKVAGCGESRRISWQDRAPSP
jgi:hypothetical protein